MSIKEVVILLAAVALGYWVARSGALANVLG